MIYCLLNKEKKFDSIKRTFFMKLTYSIKIKSMTYRALNLNPIFRLIHSLKENKNDSNKKTATL